MGAGASSMEEGGSMMYCHSCHRTSTMHDRTDSSDLSCPSCNSSFIEEMPSRPPRHRVASQQDLSSDQTRRLANAAIMLRLLESQLQSELEQLQTVLSEDDNLMSPIMKKKLRRVDLDVDMICSQPSCPICAMDFEVGSEKLQLPCNHLYCEDCVTPWLDKKKTCPICRFTLTNDVPTVPELTRFSYMELKDLHDEVVRENREDMKKDSMKDESESKFRREAAGQVVNPALGITVDAERCSDMNDIDTTASESGAKSITCGGSGEDNSVIAKRALAEEISKLLQIKKDRDEYEKRRNLGEVINANRARTLRQLLRGQSLLNESSGGLEDTSISDPLREGRRTEEERRANPSASNRTIREILNEEEERIGHRLGPRSDQSREALSTPPRTMRAQFPAFSEMARLSPDASSSVTANESSGDNDEFMRSIGNIISSTNMGMSTMDEDDDDDDPPMPTLRMMEDDDARLDRELAEATEALTEAENAVSEGRRAAAQLNASRDNPPSTPALRSGIMPLTFVVRSNGTSGSPNIERREALREAIESTT